MKEIIARLSQKTRKQDILWQRYYMFNLLKDQGYTLQQIADKFGLKRHSTVIHGIRNHKAWRDDIYYINNNKPLLEELDKCKELKYIHFNVGDKFIGRNSRKEDYEMDTFQSNVGDWYVGKKGCYKDVKRIEICIDKKD